MKCSGGLAGDVATSSIEMSKSAPSVAKNGRDNAEFYFMDMTSLISL